MSNDLERQSAEVYYSRKKKNHLEQMAYMGKAGSHFVGALFIWHLLNF